MIVKKQAFHWEYSISLGNVLTLIAMLCSIWALSLKLEGRLVRLETRVDLLIGNKILAYYSSTK